MLSGSVWLVCDSLRFLLLLEPSAALPVDIVATLLLATPHYGTAVPCKAELSKHLVRHNLCKVMMLIDTGKKAYARDV